ncbi:MAG: NAD(P)H-dependent oxidoreductase subunit E, partial [Burkholderiaceae bacterium]
MRPVFEETRPLASVDDMRRQIRQKSKLKGRQADDSAIEQVQALIGEGPYRRDLLIEYLHVLNDTYLGLKDVHMVAVAKLMRLPMAEVYEVASFYHHFDILRDGDTPSAITIRVCDGLSCNLKGAQDLLHKLPAMLGQTDARVVHVPCVGRCEQAPVAVVYQNPIVFATTDAVLQAVASQALEHPLANSPSSASFEPGDLAQQSVVTDNTTAGVSPDYVGFDAYCAGGGYALVASLEHASVASVEACIKAMEDSGLRGLGGAGFPAGRKWRIVRDQSAPKLMAVNIDEG